MLRAVDTVVEVIAWSVAVFFVILLFAGPRVVAEDKAQTPATAQDTGAAPPAGEAVFKDNCGSCHTLARAGTSGTTGPNLDDVALDAAAIEGIVRNGFGTMPSFGDKLSDADVKAVAAYVAGN